MDTTIPCTVTVLTHNSAATLARALESVRYCSEIIVCDGNSTDDTRAIAEKYGAKIIPQSSEFLASDGSIINFSGVRNQMLEASSHDWILVLDSDEYMSEEVMAEIRSVVYAGVPAAYFIPRKYVYRGTVIDNANTYPTQQMRFFNRTCTNDFIKKVHERISLKEGVHPAWLTWPMLVPLPNTAEEMIRKWRQYLSIEVARRSDLTLRKWLQIAVRELSVAALFFLRTIRISIYSRGSRLPWSFELARIWYQFALVHILFLRIRKF